MSTERFARHARLSSRLTRLSDGEAVGLVGDAALSIGGTTASVQVDGEQVFIKSVPLTDLERRNERSTANLFSLPNCYHYGIGSTGFGAWRELAVHDQTTAWVVAGEHSGFPLLHHWRILPGTAAPSVDLESAVEFWEGSPAVRARLEALERSTARLVLFLEHFPNTLGRWLDTADADAIRRVDRALVDGSAFMKAHGLAHLDAHFENILTDGDQLYFADFGLSLSAQFELSPAEADFLKTHANYDRNYTASRLVNALKDRPDAAAIVARYAPIAGLMNPFFRALQCERRTEPYPAAALDRAWP